MRLTLHLGDVFGSTPGLVQSVHQSMPLGSVANHGERPAVSVADERRQVNVDGELGAVGTEPCERDARIAHRADPRLAAVALAMRQVVFP